MLLSLVLDYKRALSLVFVASLLQGENMLVQTPLHLMTMIAIFSLSRNSAGSKETEILLLKCFNFIVKVGITFSFIPSPNITILQSTAVYQCTLIGAQYNDHVAIYWKINGTGSTYSSFESFISNAGIIVTGKHTRNSTVYIPGDPALNQTTVKCIASGTVNDKSYYTFDSATLYIQGNTDSILKKKTIIRYFLS